MVLAAVIMLASGAASRPASCQSLPERETPSTFVLSTTDQGPSESVCVSFNLNLTQETRSTCDQFTKAAKGGQWDVAAASASRLRGVYRDNGVGEFCLGYLALKQGRYISAVRHLQAAVDRSPDVPLAHLNLGVAFLALQQYKLFEEEMRWVIGSKPSEALPHFYLGLHYSGDLGQLDQAFKCFQEAISRNPNDFQSHYQLGKLLQAKGDLEGARSKFETAKTKASEQGVVYGQALEGLAEIYLRLGDFADGLRQAQMAATTDSKSASARLLLGKLLVQRGDCKSGIEELKVSALLDPTYAAPHYWLSRAYQQLGLADAAKRELEVFSRIKATYGSE
jgi:tetratricopeptide (TPR) repeat protein